LLHVLIVEDNPYDAELAVHELRRAGLEFDYQTVDSEAGFVAALSPELDVILCDFALPGFDGLQGGALPRARPLPLPFIIVSATIGEENAVATLKSGAADYLLKDRLARLGPAVEDAVAKRRLHREAAAAQAQLHAREERLRALVEHSSDAFAMYDCAGRPLYLSPSNARLLGLPLEDLSKLDAFALVSPSELGDYRARFFKLCDSPGAFDTWEAGFRHSDGSSRWLETVANNLLEEPAVGAIVVCYRDLTERRRQDARIIRLTRMHSILSAMRGALLRVHDRGLLIQEACRVAVTEGGLAYAWVGLTLQDQLLSETASAGAARRALPHKKTAIQPGSPAAEALKSGQPVVEQEIRATSGMGIERQRLLDAGLRSAVSLPLGDGERMQGVMVLYSAESGFFDATEVRLLEDMAGDIAYGLEGITREERVKHLAYYDGLTGLPNRAQFFERLEHDIRAADADGRQFAAILFDVLRFRHFNDMLGWRGGDRLLTTLAAHLGRLAGENFLARLGNDRFCILLPVGDANEATRFVEASLAPNFEIEFSTARGAYTAQLRAGAALFPKDGKDVDSLLRNAEAAVAEIKQSKVRKYAPYSPEMNARASEILALEGRLRRAMNRGEFELHYQPKVAFDSGELCGLEALIRWEDPDLGPVSANEFIPVLEETGLILEVGRWVLQQAVADRHIWTAQGLDVPRISVNVSPLQLRERDFHRQVLAAAGQSDGELDLEITENVLMHDLEENIRKLHAVREAGLGIAIDDFGTGYSSLSCLARLPINKLKVDQSFVRIMTSSPEDMAIVSTIISLAHSLGFEVVAEGVETEEQARFLTLLRCDEGQGFLFEYPLTAGEIGTLLREKRTLLQLPH
jgi:diguanylate cyclase (GGDEF)-like protein/PAS domain S-box-containing protein